MTRLNNPIRDVPQWMSAAEISCQQNILNYPFTIGKKFDIQKSKLELEVLENTYELDLSIKL